LTKDTNFIPLQFQWQDTHSLSPRQVCFNNYDQPTNTSKLHPNI